MNSPSPNRSRYSARYDSPPKSLTPTPIPASPLLTTRNTTPTPSRTQSPVPKGGIFDKEPPSALYLWSDTKLAEWESGKQDREARLTKIMDGSQGMARERNKQLDFELQRLREEFDQDMVEGKKADRTPLDVEVKPKKETKELFGKEFSRDFTKEPPKFPP